MPMTLAQLLANAYQWAVANSSGILFAGITLAVVGTCIAWLAKRTGTNKRAHSLASVLVGTGICFCVLEIFAILIAQLAFEHSVLDTDVVLLLTPLVCLGVCLLGVRLIFPLDALASVRTFRDIAMFVLACIVVMWFFSKFRGWGFLFFGSLGQLIVIVTLGYFVLRRLYRQAVCR
jgi:hypothetical protein